MPEILPIRNRPERRFKFTTKRIEDYAPPGSGRVELADTGCPGLKLRVTETGAKSFCVFRKLNGRPVRVVIGPFPTIGLDAARNEARKIVADMVRGIDPRVAKREAREVATFGELADAYLELHAKPKKKSWREDARQLDTYLKPWRSRSLSDIRREHVATLHAKLGKENGQFVANRVLALLSGIYTWAERERGWEGGNPARGIQRFREAKRERFLSPDELPAFFKAVNAEPSQRVRDYVLVSLLTGARKSNVLAMRWEQLDLDRGIWTIPETKSGKPVVLPLVPDVVKILRARPRKSAWVFPSRVEAVGHMKDPYRQWRDILKRAGLSDLRPHDLRRTLGSWQAANGVSLPIIGKSLGHTSTAATEVYSRLHLDPVRAAVTAATAAIVAAGKKGRVRK